MKRILVLTGILIMVLATVVIAEPAIATLQEMYAQAELLVVHGDYTGAAEKFEALGAYSNASQMAMYCKAINAAENLGLYVVAVDTFSSLGNFKDSKQLAQYYKGRYYEASGLIDVESSSDIDLYLAIDKCNSAIEIYYELALFKDSMERIGICTDKIDEIDIEKDKRSNARKESIYQDAITLEQNKEYIEAVNKYKEITDYKDCNNRIKFCESMIPEQKYQMALNYIDQDNYLDAMKLLREIGDYKDSIDLLTDCRNIFHIKSAVKEYYNNLNNRITYNRTATYNIDYEYDDNDHLYIIYEKDTSSDIYDREVFTIDDAGIIISSEGNGLWSSRYGDSYVYNRKYDKYGNIVFENKTYRSKEDTNFDGDTTDKIYDFLYDENGIPTSLCYTENHKTSNKIKKYNITFENSFNKNGQVIEQSGYIEDSLVLKITYYYDEYSRLKVKTETIHYNDINYDYRTEITYSY